MGHSVKPASAKTPAAWNYVDVQVLDGDRVLHPTHLSFDRLIFAEPPNLSSESVHIVITNNGQSHTSQAHVLPHDSTATPHPDPVNQRIKSLDQADRLIETMGPRSDERGRILRHIERVRQ